ncbi:MAG: diguanylate cyclase [Campylobacterota bacterium]|nr:diguanylate cyclase [Campylobacterota bacterium]
MSLIKDIVVTKNISVDISSSIEFALDIMSKNKQGVIVVLDEDIAVGIITERDILQMMNRSIDFQASIKSILSPNTPIAINIKRSVEYALHILIDNNIRRLIIIDDEDNFIGVVTQDILINHLEDNTFQTNLIISNFITETKDLVCLNQKDNIEEAFKLMNEQNIGSLIAIDDNQNPIGILTERDTVYIVNKKLDLKTSIKDVMSTPIISVCETQEVKKVVDLMKKKSIRRVLILKKDTNKPHSILSVRDIAHNLKGNYGHMLEKKLKNVKNTLNYMGESVFEICQDNGEYIIQWANEKAIKNFGKIIDKNILSLIDEKKWKDIEKRKQCDNIKIKIDDMYFEMICSQHYVNDKESWLIILRDISKFEYAIIDANKESEATRKELGILQGVIDQQKSIVIVSDGFNVISANKSLFKFFNVKDIEEFISTHKNISSMFINHKNFFSSKSESSNWIEDLLKLDIKDRIVSILDLNDFEPKAFTVQANSLSSDDKNYVVTLTDITEIKLESQQYHFHATHDALTGIYNRSYYFEKIANEIEQSKRYDTKFCIVLFDIDHFKKFNDIYGHLKGDEVLIKLSQTIQSHTRASDTFARWGGEEFIILLEKTTIDKAELIAEHFRKMVESMKIEDIEKVTASFGVTQYLKGDDDNSILKRADEALYSAKDAGRNKVVVK